MTTIGQDRTLDDIALKHSELALSCYPQRDNLRVVAWEQRFDPDDKITNGGWGLSDRVVEYILDSDGSVLEWSR